MTTETLFFRRCRIPSLLTALALSGICFLLALFCLELIVVSGQISPLWFPTAFMTVIAFRLSLYESPLVLFLCFLSIVLASTLVLGIDVTHFKFAFLNVLQAILGGVLLRLLLDRREPLNSLLDWCKLLLSVGVITPFLSGLVAMWMLNITDQPGGHFFITWVIAEIIGMLTLAPVCLLWQRRRPMVDARQLSKILLVIAVSSCASYFSLRFMPWPFTLIIVILFTCAVCLPRFAAFTVFLINASLVSVMLALRLVDLRVDNDYAPWLPFLLVLVPSHMMSLVMHSFRAEKAHISENEVRFRHAMEYSSIGMAMVAPDGNWLRVNQALCLLLGYQADELIRMTFQQLTYPDDIPQNIVHMRKVLSGEQNNYTMEKRYLRKDGEIVWARLASSLVRDANNEPLYFISQIQDITELTRTEETNRRLMERITETNAALFAEKERMLITFGSIDEAVISTDEEMRVTFMNPIAERMSGWSQEQAVGKALSDILLITQGAMGIRMENLLLRTLPAAKTTPNFDEDLVLHNSSEERFDIHYSITPLKTQEGQSIGSVMVIRDVSESRAIVRRLTYSASHDTLTHLPNRASFEHQLKQLLQNVSEQQQRHVLVFIDLDRFKAVNDTAGHAAGDALLRELSTLMLNNLRDSDFLARLGGDEFGLLMSDCSLDNATAVIQRLVSAVNNYLFEWQGNTYQVGASAGMTQIDGTNCQSSEVMSQADAACYNAKHNGRGQLQIYQELQFSPQVSPTPHITQQSIDALQVQLFTWAVTPPRKTLSVSFYLLEAIRFVDQTNPVDEVSWRVAMQDPALQVAFDRKVMNTFFASYAQPLASKAIVLVMPLSTAAMQDSTFVDELLRHLADGALPATQLWFSVDAEMLLSEEARSQQAVVRLRACGCQIVLQNFGRNLDAFNKLRTDDIDYLMMSPDLVSNLHCNLMDEMLVSIIHGHAEQREIMTIAGPVELPAGLSRLATLGINVAWGNAVSHREPLNSLVQNSYVSIK